MYQTAAIQANRENSSTTLPKGYAFNLLLFLVFVFPEMDMTFFQAGFIITSVREVSLVLLPVVYLCYPNPIKPTLSLNTRYWILAFFVLLVATELIKKVYFDLSMIEMIKNFRGGIPLFSGLLICLQGKKIDPELCLKTILTALIISFLATPVLVLSGIEPAVFNMDGREIEVQYLQKGRLANDNYEFGLIGVALLFLLPKARTREKGLKRLLTITATLSIIILVLYFNRTTMAAAFLLGVILFFKNFNPKAIAYVTATLVITVAIGGYFYLTNKNIKDQIQDRIFYVFQEEEGLAESVYYDKREVLYAEYKKQLEEHWLLGLPGGESMVDMGNTQSTRTDISFLNVWIRYGLISLFLYLIILLSIYLDHKEKLRWLPDQSLSYQLVMAVLLTFPLFALVSLNVDALFAHNAILFLLLLVNFYNVEDY